MVYDKMHQAKEVFRRYKEIDPIVDIECFTYSKKFKDLVIGDFILFQHIKSNKISRPILGVFVGYSFWDMAVVINFVEIPRAYCYSDKYLIIVNKELELNEYIGHQDPEIERIAIWNDTINLLGHFKGKPSLKDLRTSLKTLIK